MPDTLIEPAYRTCPPYTKTYGDEVIDLAGSVDLTLDDFQRALEFDWFSARPTSDEWNVTEGAIICPRQNLKTVALEAAVLAKLFLFRDRLITWTAHKYDTAQEAFLDIKVYVDNYDHLRKAVKSISIAKGDESIELVTGERLQFLARTSHGGRGMSGDTLILDEALKLQDSHMGALIPTLSARRGAQILYGSSAGDAPASVLRSIRDRGRAGQGRLAYTEFCAADADCDLEDCSHRPDTPGCALDREDLLYDANPALGMPDRLQLEFIQQTERRSMPPTEFTRERFGWWDDPAEVHSIAMPEEVWKRCADPTSTLDGKPTLAVAMTPDRGTVSLVAAGIRSDGQAHIEVVRHGRAGEWFVPEVVDVARRQNAEVALHPGHAVGALLPELEAARLRLVPTNNGDYTQACGAFYDAAMDGRLHYRPPQPELDDAVRRASRRAYGEAWRWSGDDICALVAATQALAQAKKPRRGGKGRIICLGQ